MNNTEDTIYNSDDILNEVIKGGLEFDAKHIPGVMNQIITNVDGNELRIHNFLKQESDTYIHSHQRGFYSKGLSGRYKEFLYDILENDENSHFQFLREKGGIITSLGKKTGKINNYKTRFQYKGNVLKTDSRLFHAISKDGDEPPTTMIIKEELPEGEKKECRILSPTKQITNPSKPVITATDEQIHKVLEHIKNILNNNIS